MAEEGNDRRCGGAEEWADRELEDFLRAPLTGCLSEVPGIGLRDSGLLGEGEGDDCIKNTFQLIGKFLMLRGSNEEDGTLVQYTFGRTLK
ncbi:conserved unknown protein [Ectocarpus siliculosus]|uniref:Uncharacterized protein n=1 Tax=Ectocarpus siliculosus TaxID=2880 RepID=D8LR10_ECTSI|nr:conserved unknown protein [Ectocarpus siliculosus]|eukprot:CBN77683.1 conserved unknown protein [Ectocarpus siliculosus]